jgi:serine/threonine-protein kinase
MTEIAARLKTALADRYAIERELGAGGMATVYLAEDLKHHRPVAVKVLRPELAAVLGAERFLKEIEVTANLRHPHILPLFDSGEADGFLYYVMPYVEGESLRDRLNREKQLPLDDALQFAREVADALSYAHRHDVIHRDIKPENILLEAGHAVIADFGIARAVTVAGGERLTETGLSLGTPAYMSPEQAAGSKELGGRSDVYSLGCVLYEMLGGSPPFQGPTAESVVHQHIAVEAPPITNLRPAVPAEIAGTIARALAKAPADRFATAEQFTEGLELQRTQGPAAAARSGVLLRRWWAVAAALLVGVGSWQFFTRSTVASDGIERLAVLPPDNLMRDTAQDYFVAGMHEQLISKLNQIPQLDVISRTSTMRYRGTEKTVPEIARELDVDAVLESSVLRIGDTVRIEVQLIAALPRERHLWSHTYDKPLEHVLALHSEVAQAVAEQINARLTPEDRARLASAPTVDPEVQEKYLLAAFHYSKGLEEDVNRAIAYLEDVIATDSTYAPAYALLANCYLLLRAVAGGRGGRGGRPIEVFPKVRRLALRAVELDPTLADGHLLLAGVLARYDWDWAGAEAEYRRVIDLNPGSAEGHSSYAGMLAQLGRRDEAISEARRAVRLDPVSPSMVNELAFVLYFAREYDQAIERAQQALQLESDFVFAQLTLGMAWTEQGRHEAAVGAFEKMFAILPTLTVEAWLAYGYARAGSTTRARSIIDEIAALHEQRYAVPPSIIAGTYLALGERELAIQWLESALRDRGPDMGMLPADPRWDPLRSDPRFQDVLYRMNLGQ